MKASKELTILKPDKLQTHPENMRKFYPADQVREMADSIAAGGGVLEPLIITKGKGDKWIVIDGNMRLAAAHLLTDKCPPLECKIVDQTRAEQLLSMIVANQMRYDVDPVSEALHYRALEAEGFSIREISKRTGVYESRINTRIILAKLEPSVQCLISDGKLSSSALVARALLKLTASVRCKLAERVSKNPNMKIDTIINACERLASNAKPEKKLKRPAAELSGALSCAENPLSVKDIKEAARKVCQQCNQFDGIGKDQAPAWSLIVHAADETCGKCELKDMQNICGSCPAVELLRRLVVKQEGQRVKR